jgi:hypothetical protein
MQGTEGLPLLVTQLRRGLSLLLVLDAKRSLGRVDLDTLRFDKHESLVDAFDLGDELLLAERASVGLTEHGVDISIGFFVAPRPSRRLGGLLLVLSQARCTRCA